MTEFDFDELDKAVNSLMKKTPAGLEDDSTASDEDVIALPGDSTEPLAVAPSQAVDQGWNAVEPTMEREDSAVASSPLTEVSLDKSELVSEPIRSDEPPTDVHTLGPLKLHSTPERGSAMDGQKSLVTKRRGTFMDVVHPSSDMRIKQPDVSARPVSRQSSTIAPIDTVQDTEARDETPTPVTENHQSVAPRSSNDSALADLLSEHTNRQSDSLATMNDEDLNDSHLLPTETEVSSPARPPAVNPTHESLFIADAKVEKRPLGMHPLSLESESADESDASEDLVKDPIKMGLPDELSGKIMAIESEKEITKVHTEPVQASVSSSAAQTIASSAISSKSAGPQGVSASSVPVNQPAGTIQEEDNPGIYDPAYYKQETKPKVKKKSGWGVMLAIIGLIILGGAGGVLYYLYSTGSF